MTSKELFLLRVRSLSLAFILVALMLLLRYLTIVLNYSYPYFSGIKGILAATVILTLSANFLYITYLYFQHVGEKTVLSWHNIKREWSLLTPLGKILAVSGVLGLPVSLQTLSQWLVDFVQYLIRH